MGYEFFGMRDGEYVCMFDKLIDCYCSLYLDKSDSSSLLILFP